MSNEMVVMDDKQGAIEVQQQVNQIQYLMKKVLKEGEHYGTVPGCGNKPTLLQPGAEKIAYMFHLIPSYEVTRRDLGHCHREYEVTCTLTHRDTGEIVGGGMGLCSTLESKYRYRNKWVNGKKVREENPDIADVLNTVLKIAKKRAFVDAVKSTTAASDIFTQDIEDMGFTNASEPSKPAESDEIVKLNKQLWHEVGELKKQALSLDVQESTITSWMEAHIKAEDGSAKAHNTYKTADILKVRDYLQTLIRDAETTNVEEVEIVDAEIVEDGLYDEDVPF